MSEEISQEKPDSVEDHWKQIDAGIPQPEKKKRGNFSNHPRKNPIDSSDPILNAIDSEIEKVQTKLLHLRKIREDHLKGVS